MIRPARGGEMQPTLSLFILCKSHGSAAAEFSRANPLIERQGLVYNEQTNCINCSTAAAGVEETPPPPPVDILWVASLCERGCNLHTSYGGRRGATSLHRSNSLLFSTPSLVATVISAVPKTTTTIPLFYFGLLQFSDTDLICLTFFCICVCARAYVCVNLFVLIKLFWLVRSFFMLLIIQGSLAL